MQEKLAILILPLQDPQSIIISPILYLSKTAHLQWTTCIIDQRLNYAESTTGKPSIISPPPIYKPIKLLKFTPFQKYPPNYKPPPNMSLPEYKPTFQVYHVILLVIMFVCLFVNLNILIFFLFHFYINEQYNTVITNLKCRPCISPLHPYISLPPCKSPLVAEMHSGEMYMLPSFSLWSTAKQ